MNRNGSDSSKTDLTTENDENHSFSMIGIENGEIELESASTVNQNITEARIDRLEDDVHIVEQPLDLATCGVPVEQPGVPVEQPGVPVEQPSDLAKVDVTVSLEGLEAIKWQDIEKVYKRHAQTVGFSFKRSTQRTVNGVITEKYLLCSCSGHPPIEKRNDDDDDGSNKKQKKDKDKNDTKTNCKAGLRMKKQPSGFFKVKHHNMLHNHNLTRPGWQYMHRVERHISDEKGEMIKTLDKAGIKPSDAYRAGGVEKVGHTKRDQINYVGRLKTKELDGNDAQMVINKLTKLREEDPNFYFSIKLDPEGRLEAIYWTDARMRKCYKIFGDVVIFDTTYKTNKYDLICGPFVGVNNHWSTIMFACSFIARETTETFVWLFNELLDSMDQKKPQTIFTEQDAAMAKAIKQVFGEKTKHRLCLWHLHKNAVKKCGKLNKNQDFMEAFNHCLKGCTDCFEFEESWRNMIEKFELKDHEWFEDLYEIKDKWCTAYSKDFFSAGMLSSQRSESTNNAIGFKTTKHTSLDEFFTIFWECVERWRETEKTNEFNCSWKRPRAHVDAGILSHAATVYTKTIFRFFEDEFEACLVLKAVTELKLGNKTTYLVSPEDDPEEKPYLVICTIKGDDVEITCNCKHFVVLGWLCSHCLRVMFINNINRIPASYINQRWTKEAQKHIWDSEKQVRIRQENDSEYWTEYMIKRYSEMVKMSVNNLDARRLLEDSYTANDLAIKEIVTANRVEDKSDAACVESAGGKSSVGEQISVGQKSTIDKEKKKKTERAKKVLDPIKAITKGRKGKQPTKRSGRRKAVTYKFNKEFTGNKKII